MTEGWHGDEYLVIFSQEQSSVMAEKYQLARVLPGFLLVGLLGWDDFIVMRPDGVMLKLPTVPMNLVHASPYALPEQLALEPDERFTGKVKWYLKPLVFGGDAEADGNITWVSLDQHAQLVVWWNAQYRTAAGQGQDINKPANC